MPALRWIVFSECCNGAYPKRKVGEISMTGSNSFRAEVQRCGCPDAAREVALKTRVVMEELIEVPPVVGVYLRHPARECLRCEARHANKAGAGKDVVQRFSLSLRVA